MPGTIYTGDDHSTRYTQELRLSISIDRTLDWMVGVFYTYSDDHPDYSYPEVNPASGAIAGEIINSDYFPTTYEEYAAFTNVTFHITDKINVQVGVRESENRQFYMETIVGLYGPDLLGLPSPVVNPPLDTKDDSFTYLLTPQYKISNDFIVYARLASGYRTGGPNFTGDVFHYPPEFGPDKTKNYEVGTKGSFLDNRLSVDASIYYIDWKNIQLGLLNAAGAAYTANASGAKSQGVELTVEAKPATGLKLAAWASFDDAVLTQGFPPSASEYGVTGDRLPFSSRWSGNLSGDQAIPISGDLNGFVGASFSYVGDRIGYFTSIPERPNYPGYGKTDLRAGCQY